jgi:arabinofuranan 3-O-arabinosyltransferase
MARRRLHVRRDEVALGAFAFALGLLQRPGWASSDTKIDLHVDPVGFLADVASVWSPTGDLGHVHGGQYAGYLFPMGPFFALGDLAGLPEWLVHRLWLGAVLAIAAIGMARLADAFVAGSGERVRPDSSTTVIRLAAGAVALLNPYVVAFANRTSITLLAYALLPWMLLAVHRGLRNPRGWWWPVALALLAGAAGGGVNVAVLGWLALAPLVLVVYEPAIGTVSWRDSRQFAWRAAACLAVASLWWVAPVVVHAAYGRDFLPFTEQPGVIWGTTSASEALRLMGYWTSYIGVGYGGDLRPFTSDGGVMLFHPAVVTATLLVPALAVAALLAVRRWTYAPYCLILILAGALIVMAGFPDGAPPRRAALFAYFHLPGVQFLRTTYKAAPLMGVAYALLAGAAAPRAWVSLGAPHRPRAARAAAAGAVLAVLALAAYPLVRGDAVDSQLAWKEVPRAWTDAARDLDGELPDNTRAVVLPGQPFATYRWGSTVDPILPALTNRPVALRNVVPYADLRAVDLLWTTDALLQQERLLPGQLPPLLRLLGAGAVVTGTDDLRARSGALEPAGAAALLASQPGFERPARTYGQPHRLPGETGTLDSARRLPRVARRDLPGGPGIVRVQPLAPETLVDGSAATLTGLAAFGALDADRPLAYAADRTAAEVRAAARAGAELVVGDGNRRRLAVASRTRQDAGPTIGAAEELPPDGAMLDPLDAGSAAQTVAVYDGVRTVRDDPLPGVAQFPEHRPFSALDGSTGTAWIAPNHADAKRHWMEVDLLAPRDVPYLDVLPHADALGRTAAVDIGGRRFALRPGWNRLHVGLRDVETVRAVVARVDRAPGVERAPGGIVELRVPGVRARELLRPPRVLEDTVRGSDLRRSSLTYLFERTTGASPFRRGLPIGDPQARQTRDRGDAEAQIARRIAPPAGRPFTADAWVTVAPTAPDARIDDVAGTSGGRFSSSGRFEGRPGRRASRAFDGDGGTAWIAPWDGEGAWVAWTAPRTVTVRRLGLRFPHAVMRRPRQVVVRADGRATPPVAVGAGGRVELPEPLRGRAFRLEVTAASFPAATSGRIRQRRAVGIAEVTGAGVRATDGGGSRIGAACGALVVRAAERALPLRPVGSTADLDAGRPLRAVSCGTALALPAAEVDVTTQSDLFRPYWLRLRSPAPDGLPALTGGGRLVDPGRLGRSDVEGMRLDLDGPSWLVLGQSYDRGWRAWCDGEALGAPRPAAAFGNGWRVPRSCARVRFAYAPDRVVRATLVMSGGLSVLALLVLLARGAPPGRRSIAPAFAERADHPARMPWGRAVALGLAAGIVAAGLLALRAGAVVAPVTVLVARYGIGARPLILGAAGLLGLAVPAAYLLFEPEDRGGYNFSYAGDLLGAHWLAVAALVLLALALWRIVSARTTPPAPDRPRRAARASDSEPAA